MSDESDEKEQHEIYACFLGGPGEPYYQPSLSCSCGFSCRERTWEEAGLELDEHLATVEI